MAYIRTLFHGMTGLAVGIHLVEDIGLLSIGRFAPLPWWGAFAIGISFSWLMMGAIIYWVQRQGRRA